MENGPEHTCTCQTDEGDIENDEDWEVFDNIKFRFIKGWHKKYKEVPILTNVTS